MSEDNSRIGLFSQRGPVELTVFALSLLLILTTLGLFIYDGIIKKSRPPTVNIDLKRDAIERMSEGFRM